VRGRGVLPGKGRVGLQAVLQQRALRGIDVRMGWTYVCALSLRCAALLPAVWGAHLAFGDSITSCGGGRGFQCPVFLSRVFGMLIDAPVPCIWGVTLKTLTTHRPPLGL